MDHNLSVQRENKVYPIIKITDEGDYLRNSTEIGQSVLVSPSDWKNSSDHMYSSPRDCRLLASWGLIKGSPETPRTITALFSAVFSSAFWTEIEISNSDGFIGNIYFRSIRIYPNE